jgi:xylose isomerase
LVLLIRSENVALTPTVARRCDPNPVESLESSDPKYSSTPTPRFGWIPTPRDRSRSDPLNEPVFSVDAERVRYAGEDAGAAFGFKVYNPELVLLGRRMEDWLRVSVAYWHSFAWNGSDMFGSGTLDRPWQDQALDPMEAARLKMAAAFEFISKLGVPFYCFHDADIAPAGSSFRESKANLGALADEALGYQERIGVRLLWGTANLFSHPRYHAGAATNPDPAVFAYAAAQVTTMLSVTKRLGGSNYVLWGGREGYDSLLNTDLRREGEQLARFLYLVAEEKHRIGFQGTLLVEPKPMEPTAHQYDRDAAVVHGFLARHGLENEYKLNIEANHATLAGHSFHHEVAYASAHGLLGSIDANRGNPQNGWDTDQFPNSVDDLVMPLYEIIRAGGLRAGGFNFDAKLRRQSIDLTDLFHAHIGGIDTLARALIAATRLEENGTLAAMQASRYEDWDTELGREITSGSAALNDLAERIESGAIDPRPVSGKQELYENLVSDATWAGSSPE